MTMQDAAAATADEFADLGLEPPTTADAIVRNADRILPVVAEEADESERLARLSPRAERVMRRSGVFELGFARHRGGVEGTLRQQVDVVAKVAAIDAGSGWNIGVLNAGGYYATRIPQDGFDELFGDTLDHPTSGAFHLPGRADVVEGGYMVTGDWGWGSGSYIADYIVGGCLVYDQGEPVIGASGKQALYGMFLPRESIVFAHDWQVLGVRSSGSTSYAIPEPTFIPSRHVFDREPLDSGDKDPLNKSVHIAFLGLTGICLGIAEHAVRLAATYLRERYAANPARSDPGMLQLLGEAATEVEVAYASTRAAADSIDATLFTPGAPLDAFAKGRLSATNAQAGVSLRRVLNLTTEIAQSAYVFDREPLQRVLRDGFVALAHAGTRRMAFQSVGRAHLDSADGAWQL
jgi:alkylation response protein AidB-like acyl-CoA dehydrogenase